MEKKSLHILTALFTLILIALFPLSADAYSVKTVDNVVYRMFEEDGEKKAIVCDFVDDEETTKLNILSEVDGYKVTSVEPEPRVHYLTTVTEVTVGENIECLYDCAFIGFESLKKVNLPSTLTYIGERVFSRCPNLEKINLDYVTYIGTNFLDYNRILKSINLPKVATTLGKLKVLSNLFPLKKSSSSIFTLVCKLTVADIGYCELDLSRNSLKCGNFGKKYIIKNFIGER